MSSVAKKKQPAGQGSGGFWSELFRFGLYKPNQGRIVRQLTFLTIALLGLLVAYEFYRTGWFDNWFAGSRYITLVALGSIGVWFAFRVVNYSAFADFLIAVQAEMNKVSWPTRGELWRSSVVVIFVIFFLAALLFAFDAIWTVLFKAIRIRF
jgi:preprotein translocase subunit SecE